jgi:hypothetical protein
LAQQARDYGGHDDLDPTGKRQHDIGAGAVGDGMDSLMREAMTKGKEAVQSNMENAKNVAHKTQYKGENFPTDESVPGSTSAEGYEAPPSVTEVSRESASYQ